MKALNIAKRKSNESTFERARIGCVITKGGRVLTSKCNQIRYHKDLGKTWPSVHAEEAAILDVLSRPDGQRDLIGSKIYIARITKTGSSGLAKPCPRCQALIEAVGIKRIYYTE